MEINMKFRTKKFLIWLLGLSGDLADGAHSRADGIFRSTGYSTFRFDRPDK
jgi:hypothetical protein